MHRPKFHGILRNLSMTGLLFLCAVGPVPVTIALEPVVIKLWDHHVHDKKFRQQIFKQFNRDNPEIKVEYTSQVGDTLTTVLEAAFRSGTPPDMFVPAIPGGLAKAVEMGWVIPLDEVAPSRGELEDWMARFPQDKQPFAETVNVFNGKVYSWPVGSEGGRMMLFWNTKLFLDAGLRGPDGASQAPDTWEKIRLYARKVTELGQGKTYGIVHGIKTPETWGQDITWSLATLAGWTNFGVHGGFDPRTGLFDFHSSALRGAIQLWIDMKNDGSVFPGELSMDDEQAKFRFAQDLAGMIFGGPWVPGGLLAVNPDLQFDTVLPSRAGELKGSLVIGPVAATSEYVVSSKVKDRSAMWKVVQFMTSQTYQEGWVKAGGGFSVFPEYNRPEYFPHPTIAKIAQMLKLRPVGPPFPSGAAKVWELLDPGVPYHIGHIITGIYIGQLGWDAFDDYERLWNDAFDRALTEARKFGVNLTRADFTFQDWDPVKGLPASALPASRKK